MVSIHSCFESLILCYHVNIIITIFSWILQKLGWAWQDLVCFSSSLGWCCFLTKLFWPLEMWVDHSVKISPPYAPLNLIVYLCSLVQILFVSGLSFVIGLERTFRFFFQRHKVKATSFFLGGVFVVLIGWPIIGVVLEIYGFFLLFRSAWIQCHLCLLKNLTLFFVFLN